MWHKEQSAKIEITLPENNKHLLLARQTFQGRFDMFSHISSTKELVLESPMVQEKE